MREMLLTRSLCMMLLFTLDLNALLLFDFVAVFLLIDVLIVVDDVEDEVVETDDEKIKDVKHDVFPLLFLQVANDERCEVICDSPSQPGDDKVDEKEFKTKSPTVAHQIQRDDVVVDDSR